MVRPDLHDYCPASNLAFNEKIKLLIKKGEKVYHFAFGQAPFPIMDGMVKALGDHAHENAYLPVAGRQAQIYWLFIYMFWLLVVVLPWHWPEGSHNGQRKKAKGHYGCPRVNK